MNEPKRCSCCGQVISDREITIYSGMVRALLRVYYWSREEGRHEFTRKEMKHLFKGIDNEIARWGDWVYFGNGMVYKPKGRGTWGLHWARIEEFIRGERKIPSRVVIDKITKEVTYHDHRMISEIKTLGEFLDKNGEYIYKYI